MKVKDILLALCAPLLLGFGFAIAKPAMQQFPPFLLMGLRFTIAALILVWWVPIPKKLLKKVLSVSGIWTHYVAALVKSKLPFTAVTCDKGQRILGTTNQNKNMLFNKFISLCNMTQGHYWL